MLRRHKAISVISVETREKAKNDFKGKCSNRGCFPHKADF
jgi:pyruvate/2-oxoglutarate dehydrogenase complex dihydrolipoamide dehydrogenase (E3) component